MSNLGNMRSPKNQNWRVKMKEQIKETLEHYHTELVNEVDEEVGRVRMGHPERQIINTSHVYQRVTDKYADQILALFPQGEGGLLSDEEIKNEALLQLVNLKSELEGENG
jgi:hypothetical protein